MLHRTKELFLCAGSILRSQREKEIACVGARACTRVWMRPRMHLNNCMHVLARLPPGLHLSISAVPSHNFPSEDARVPHLNEHPLISHLMKKVHLKPLTILRPMVQYCFPLNVRAIQGTRTATCPRQTEHRPYHFMKKER